MADSFHQFQSITQGAASSSAGQQSPSRLTDLHTLSSAQSYANLKYLFGVQDPVMVAPVIAPKSNRNKRKSLQGPDHVKHRRTRSGCYTCRGRRVKCDEKHPICERCRKGNRVCKYPEPSNSTKSKGSAVKGEMSPTQQNPGSSSEGEEDEDEDSWQQGEIMDEKDFLEGIQHQWNLPGPHSLGQRDIEKSFRGQTSFTRPGSETPSLETCASPSPSTEGSVGYPGKAALRGSKLRTSLLSPVARRESWTHLPEDLQDYLVWFYENITCQHYSLKHDAANFLKTLFISEAMKNEALLNGIVGFTAFQRSLRYPNAEMVFLQYYNKSVSLLLRSLRQGDHRHSIGTLLTILQLATIEEYLGDWINLLGHQKAAFEILTYLYTPKNVMETEMGRCVLKWYSRFDVFGSLMGGFETVLSREWFLVHQLYFQARARDDPEELSWKIDAANATLKLIGMDMSVLFTMIGKGAISKEEFITKNKEVAKAIADWKDNIDPALQDPRYLVTDWSNAHPLDPEDIVYPYRQGVLYGGPLWPFNISNMDWLSVDLMHQYQTALILGQTGPNHALVHRAFRVCELFEAIEFWPGSPNGSVLACQAAVGIASLFLPRDDRHNMWVRRKLATIESNGYIYPLTFRTKMSALFQDPSCMEWWLPHAENYTPIVQAIRSFVETRTIHATDVPQATEDLSNMKAIFANMQIDDDATRDATKKERALHGRDLSEDQGDMRFNNNVIEVQSGWGGEDEPGGWGHVGRGVESSRGLWYGEDLNHDRLPRYDEYS